MCWPTVGPKSTEENTIRQTGTLVSDPYEVAREYFRNQRAADTPALYYLNEIPALCHRTQEERREIHAAKLAYGNVRLWQDREF
jgi:hypothetical protein